MFPGAINFTRPGLSATFNDGGGINFNSSSSLSLSAGYISIQGQSKVWIRILSLCQLHLIFWLYHLNEVYTDYYTLSNISYKNITHI